MNRHVKTVIETCFPKEHAWKMILFGSWNKIMGALASTVFIESIRESILILSAPNSCWVTELHARSHTIVERVNLFLKTKRIDRLRCVIRGTRPVQQKKLLTMQALEQADSPPPSMPPSIKKTIANNFDLETQRALIRYWQRCAVKQKSKS